MLPLTVDKVREKVARIEAIQGDYEAAHSAEDMLFELVLRSIAEGAENAPDLAREALRSLDLDFARHCA